MHTSKEEFQVLDSLDDLKNYIDVIEALVCFDPTTLNFFQRTEISYDMAKANQADKNYPDPSE
jgi:hypothetical protein